MSGLPRAFSDPTAPIAGVDDDLARQMGGLFAVIAAIYSVMLWPLAPLSAQIGPAGWLIGGVNAAMTAALGLHALNRPRFWTDRLIACFAYAGIAMIGLQQWLSGGAGQPYEFNLLLPVLLVCGIYSARVALPFMAVCAAILAAPMVYDHSSRTLVADAFGFFLLLSMMGVASRFMVQRIRSQGIALTKGAQAARAEARVDELTGIGNRRAFDEGLVSEISRANRLETPLSVAMGDIERFKEINDAFSHIEGDKALRDVARMMDRELRMPDRVFRWGGDEFAMLLPGADADGASKVLERITARVRSDCRRPDGDEVLIHFAAVQMRAGMSPEDLRESADLALLALRAHTAEGQGAEGSPVVG